MLDTISDNADFLIATANTALDASLVPTMLNQRQDKASTVPLTTSVTSVALWLFTAVVFASISLWITMCAAIVTASLWAMIAAQRFVYGDPASRGERVPGEARRLRRSGLEARMP